MVQITQQSTGNPALVSEFTYDGFRRWVKIVEKVNGSVTSTKPFVWCGKQLCERRDSSGANVVSRFFADGETEGVDMVYYERDHLGRVRELVDVDGVTVLARYEYDPYGRRSKVSGPAEGSFGYTGHYYHVQSGLHLALYRAYDADIGRWLNRDPIGEEGGLNLYGYVFNDPVNHYDPDGRSILVVILVGAVVLAVGMALIEGLNAKTATEEAEILNDINEHNLYPDDPAEVNPDAYKRNTLQIVECTKVVVKAGTTVPGTFNNGPPLGSGPSPQLHATPSPTLTGRPGYVPVRGYYRNGKYLVPSYRRYPNSPMAPPDNNLYPR